MRADYVVRLVRQLKNKELEPGKGLTVKAPLLNPENVTWLGPCGQADGVRK